MEQTTLPANMSFESSPRTRDSLDSIPTHATSVELGPLQLKENHEDLAPCDADDASSYELVRPMAPKRRELTLEDRSEMLFSEDHLRAIFSSPSTFLKFTAFLSSRRPDSVAILIYYLDALKALKAVSYANAIAAALEPLPGYDFTKTVPQTIVCKELEQRAAESFAVMTQEDLPAFITQLYISVVSESITRRITGTLPANLQEASEGLAEVFCLSDPSRPENPIVFASEGSFVVDCKLNGAHHPRISSHHSVWRRLRHWAQLSLPARPEDKSPQRHAATRSGPRWQRAP